VSIAEAGEFGLIARIVARLDISPATLLGPGDDAAVVVAPDGRVVVSTDVLVDGRHFRRDWSGAADVGHRAAAANLADIVAMGAAPTALLVALCAPTDLDAAWAEELAAGISAEAGLVGASVVGGDLSASQTLTIAVTALGDLRGAAPVVRSGAQPGDVVAVAGRIGYAAAGYTVLSRGFRTPKLLVEAYRRPEVPYAAGLAASRLGATSMIDVSDGLLQDLGHVATASVVGIDLRRDAFEVPDQMRDAANALGVDPYVWILAGGDDPAPRPRRPWNGPSGRPRTPAPRRRRPHPLLGAGRHRQGLRDGRERRRDAAVRHPACPAVRLRCDREPPPASHPCPW
jgi:thiamine-monophosphate kinase